MSYYYQHKYHFSYHGIARIKQRLKMTDLDDYVAKDKVMAMIENSSEIIDTNQYIYINLDYEKMYAVINKKNNLIITVTPISPHKMLSIITRD